MTTILVRITERTCLFIAVDLYPEQNRTAPL